MSVQHKTYSTHRFIEKWAYLGLGSSILVLFSLIIAPLFGKTLFDNRVSVSVEKPVTLTEFTLKPRPIGALRVDAKALIPTNRWVTYEIQLIDEQGNLLASAIKEAWKESGTWREGGESGTWSEQDLKGGLDVRVKEPQKVALVLNVLGYGSGNTEINNALSLQVKIKKGAIDTRHLWPGLMGSLVLGMLALIAVPLIGKTAIVETINDSDPTGRGTVGGRNKLVRVNVHVKSDETSPRQLRVRLIINNSYGEQIYATSKIINLRYKKRDGEIEEANGSFQQFFIFDTKDSYGFHVEVSPDAPIDQTTLKVKEGAHTRQSISVTHISSTEF